MRCGMPDVVAFGAQESKKKKKMKPNNLAMLSK